MLPEAWQECLPARINPDVMTILLLISVLAQSVLLEPDRAFSTFYNEVIERLLGKTVPPGPHLRIRILRDSETFQLLSNKDDNDINVSIWRATPSVETQLSTLPQIEREMENRGTDEVSMSVESAVAAVRIERRTFKAPPTSELARLIQDQKKQRVSLAPTQLLQIHPTTYELDITSESKDVHIRIYASAEMTLEEKRLIEWVDRIRIEAMRLSSSAHD